MTRYLTKALAGMAAVALAVSVAWSQGQGGWQGGTRGRWATVSPEDRQKVTALHQDIRALQLEIATLQAEGADPAVIAEKQQELTDLRTTLHDLMVSLRPATAPRAGYQGALNGNGRGPQARNQGQYRGQRGQRGQRGYRYMRAGNCPFAVPQSPAR